MSLPRDPGLRERRELIRELRRQGETASERLRTGGDPATSLAAGAADTDSQQWVVFGRVGLDPLAHFRVASS
jgi:hypothetical protein